jgi:hypothetical protein
MNIVLELMKVSPELCPSMRDQIIEYQLQPQTLTISPDKDTIFISGLHHIAIDSIGRIDISNTHHSPIHLRTFSLYVEQLKCPGALGSCPADLSSPRNQDRCAALGCISGIWLIVHSEFPSWGSAHEHGNERSREYRKFHGGLYHWLVLCVY